MLAFLAHDALDQRLIDGARRFGPGQEDGAGRIVGLVRQVYAGFRSHGAEQRIRLLN